VNRSRIARLNENGTLDGNFSATGAGVDGTIHAIVRQPDGKILIGGSFITYNGLVDRAGIARLNEDGTLDESFDPGIGVDGTVYTIALQPDDKILIGGEFTSYNGVGSGSIARLEINGDLDESFNPGGMGVTGVYAITLQPNGKVLIGGSFIRYNGTARDRIARLNADGSLDTEFNPGMGASSIVYSVYSVAVQPADGKVLIGGSFGTYAGTARNRLARLNANGSLDTEFDPGMGANDAVRALVLQSGDKVLIGGEFDAYNGSPRAYIARVVAVCTQPTAPTFAAGATTRSACGGGVVTFASTSAAEENVLIQWREGTTGDWVAGATATTSPASFSVATGSKTFYARRYNTATQCTSPEVTLTGTFAVPPAAPTISLSSGALRSSQPTGNQWLNVSRQPIDGATGQAYTPTATGTYYVRYTDAATGCTATSTGFFYGVATTSRTASLAAGGIQLYPNPTSGTLNVAVASPGSYRLQLSDLQGRVVYTTQLSGSASGTTTSLQLPSLPAGLYSVQIAGATGTYSGKLSVQ
jgi:uncharacterized delta-60 repeat protein